MNHNTEIIKNLEHQLEAARAALREAIGWNWLSHADAVDDGDVDRQIPVDIINQVTAALGNASLLEQHMAIDSVTVSAVASELQTPV